MSDREIPQNLDLGYHKLKGGPDTFDIWKIKIDDGWGLPHTFEIEVSDECSINMIYTLLRTSLRLLGWGK